MYGHGFYTAHVLGAIQHVSAALTGDKGSTLNVELYRPNTTEGLNEIKGVAVDGKGDIYKVVF